MRWHVDRATVAAAGAWALGGATAFVRRGPSGRRSLTALGAGPDVVALVDALLPEVVARRIDASSVTLPRTVPMPAAAGDEGDDWNWMAIAAPPVVVPGEERVVEVADADPAIGALLAEASPRPSLQPGAVPGSRWVGVWEAGRLIAVAGRDGGVPGAPHLASIAVRPAVRGCGLGAAVTASLSRRLLAEGAPAVSLGYYAINAVAGRMYDRLGFGARHEWSSRRVPPLSGG